MVKKFFLLGEEDPEGFTIKELTEVIALLVGFGAFCFLVWLCFGTVETYN